MSSFGVSFFKEHLCLQSTMIPLVYRMTHGSRISRILLLRPRFFICKHVWIQWVHQKKIVHIEPILEKIFDLQMKIVFFQTRPNRKQHAAFSQYSRLASPFLMLHSKGASTSLCCGTFFKRFSYSDLLRQ